MKSCPQCKQTYNDETLNFCLADGTMLVQAYSPNQQAPTVMMNSPRSTSNQQQQAVFNNPTPQFVHNQPRKKSKAWVWVLAILGVISLGGIVVFVALIGLVASLPESNSNSQSQTTKTPEKTDLFGNRDQSTTADDVLKDDLSNWEYSNPSYGSSTLENDELTMKSKASNYTFMLATPDKRFQTANATTKVTVKNVENKAAIDGFGLVIHSAGTNPGDQDYVFAIDSKSKKFRIGKHSAKKERNVVGWTSSSSINGGSEYNDLEVKDEDGTMTFYINGQSVKAIDAADDNNSGIVGLYVSGGVPIAFSNLEIKQ
jgi:hypothetical protein